MSENEDTTDMEQFIQGADETITDFYRPRCLEECVFDASTEVPRVSEDMPVGITLKVSDEGVVFVNIRWFYFPLGICQAQCVVQLDGPIHMYFVHMPSGEEDKHIPESVVEGIFYQFVIPMWEEYIVEARSRYVESVKSN